MLPEIAIFDPRPKILSHPLKLAKRTRLEELKKEKLLLYDNTKLDLNNYRTVLTTFQSHLKSNGFQQIEIFRQTIRGKNEKQIKLLADDMVATGAKGAILTLGDMGVTPAMVVLTIALEKAGVPAVCITAGPGNQLAKGFAYYRARRLCLVGLDMDPGSSIEQIEKEVTCRFDSIIDFLSGQQKKVEISALLENRFDQPITANNDCRAPRDEGSTEGQTAGEMDLLEAVADVFEAHCIGDGLPVIPATEDRVSAMLRTCPLEPQHIFCQGIGPTGSAITVKDLAINAVMAGCRPDYMAVLAAAMTAVCDPAYNLFQAITTSHGGSNCILVSGPLTKELKMNSGQGCLGAGNRANATIGRAVNLTLRNSCRLIPGFSDLSCLSSPADYSYCFAESTENSPWPTINAERFSSETTTVAVLRAEPPHNIADLAATRGDRFLETIADCCTTLGSNNAYLPGSLVVVLSPDHSRLLVRDGYNKETIRHYLHANVGHPVQKLVGRGFVGMGPSDENDTSFFKATRSSKDIEVVVAGGSGGHSGVIIPWSLHSELVIKPVLSS